MATAKAKTTKKKIAQLGKKVPAFKAEATSEQKIALSALKGKKVILYFYPKDSTSGCTKEGEAFRDHYKKFKRAIIMPFFLFPPEV